MSGTNLQVALGQAIRRKRTAAGFSQESFAEAVGVHRTYIGGVERGERNVSLQNLQRISEALNVPLSSLIHAAEKALEAETPGMKSAQVRRAR